MSKYANYQNITSGADIFWISTLGNQLTSRSSWLAKKILPKLADYAKITIFTPERQRDLEISKFEKLNLTVHNILMLPVELRKNPNAILVYNFEDLPINNILRRFISQYPGLGIFHDLTFFNSEINKFSHCTDAIELNKNIASLYGENQLELGTQVLLGRPLAIYRNFFNFLNTFNDSLVGSAGFGIEAQHYLQRYFSNVSKLELKFETINAQQPDESLPKLGRKFIVVFRSISSRASIDFKKYFADNPRIPSSNFILSINNEDTIEDLSPISEIENILSLFERNCFSGLIELGAFPQLGCSPLTLEAIERGVPSFLEEGLENKSLSSPIKFIYGKEESFFDICERACHIESSKRVSSILNTEILLENILAFIDLNFDRCVTTSTAKSLLRETQFGNLIEQIVLEMSDKFEGIGISNGNGYIENFNLFWKGH